MWLFLTFALRFHFDYICSSTAVYLICLELSKPSDLKKWFDKRCSQQVFVLLD